MKINNKVARASEGLGAKMLPLCCIAILTLGLAGCASTDPRTTQVILKDFGSCEQDLLKIRNSLCSGDLEAKPGLDPHDVIGLAKPGLDPHKVCFSTFKLSAFNSALCSCEVQKFKWMAKIESCYDDAKGIGDEYKVCLAGLKGTACPAI
ncbi:MAG: hypothetical protein WBN65_09165 [Gammaproteobacteria bacterium]